MLTNIRNAYGRVYVDVVGPIHWKKKHQISGERPATSSPLRKERLPATQHHIITGTEEAAEKLLEMCVLLFEGKG